MVKKQDTKIKTGAEEDHNERTEVQPPKEGGEASGVPMEVCRRGEERGWRY